MVIKPKILLKQEKRRLEQILEKLESDIDKDLEKNYKGGVYDSALSIPDHKIPHDAKIMLRKRYQNSGWHAIYVHKEILGPLYIRLQDIDLYRVEEKARAQRAHAEYDRRMK